jgi:hypothetical protein
MIFILMHHVLTIVLEIVVSQRDASGPNDKSVASKKPMIISSSLCVWFFWGWNNDDPLLATCKMPYFLTNLVAAKKPTATKAAAMARLVGDVR